MFEELDCPVRHYAWGETAEKSTRKPFIPAMLGIPAGTERWAELWMGSHPSGSAVIKATGVPLKDAILKEPERYLGKALAADGVRSLPFLLKVLCCSEPLSIQSHPDKKLAERLNHGLPKEFPDDNHKPEVLYALSDFTVMAGFRDVHDILDDIQRHNALHRWHEALPKFVTLRDLCEFVLKADYQQIANIADDLAEEPMNTPNEKLFLMLNEKYHGDCGTLFAFLLNVFTLKPGQAIFVGPNIPHAYLKGQGVECMANSDTVIRAGLTSKYVNRQILLATLNFTSMSPERLLIKQAGGNFDYSCGKDFRLRILSVANGRFVPDRESPAIFVVLKGTAKISADGGSAIARRGSIWFSRPGVKDASIEPLDGNSIVAWAEV